MTVQAYRIYNAGYVRPKVTTDINEAAKYAREMCQVAAASSIITDMATGKTLGGCDIDPEHGTPVSYMF
jgi:hypothetical protein